VTKLTETERGLECVMQLVQDLTGDGVVGDNELDGNEEALINDAQTIRIDQLRHGTKSKGEMAEQATVHPLPRAVQGQAVVLAVGQARRADVPDALGPRLHAQARRLDPHRLAASFAALRRGRGAPSSNRIVYAGSATSEATLTSSDKMSWELCVRARTLADRKRLVRSARAARTATCC
jgi:hypothetical protein